MKIEKGMNCRFIDPYGMECNGKVLSVRDDGFTVYEPSNAPAQYNDSVIDYTEADIGTKVWFE